MQLAADWFEACTFDCILFKICEWFSFSVVLSRTTQSTNVDALSFLLQGALHCFLLIGMLVVETVLMVLMRYCCTEYGQHTGRHQYTTGIDSHEEWPGTTDGCSCWFSRKFTSAASTAGIVAMLRWISEIKVVIIIYSHSCSFAGAVRSRMALFIALHGMQMRSSNEKAVCSSVRPSVCLSQTHGLWQNGRKICPVFLYCMKDHLA